MEITYDKQQEGPLPLEGIRLVEYGVFHAGHGSTAILGDLGGEVIKIEAGGGDPIRFWTTVAGIDMSGPDGISLTNEVANRNKKNISLDIKTGKGRAGIHRCSPRQGEHTGEIMRDLGYDAETVKHLKKKASSNSHCRGFPDNISVRIKRQSQPASHFLQVPDEMRQPALFFHNLLS